MRCPHCGAQSSVKETRETMRAFTTKRSRVCFNGHRFVTHETVATERLPLVPVSQPATPNA